MSTVYVALRAWRQSLVHLAVLLSILLACAGTAHAGVKTVNGISAEVNMVAAQRGVPYTQAIVPTGGGGAPYSFVMLAGTLPAGFSFSSDGVLSGTNCSAKNGSFPFDVRITSTTGTVADFVGTNQFSVQMTAGPSAACSLTLNPLNPTATVNSPYSSSAAVTGGVPPYTYTVASGSLPPGLSLDPITGAVNGTPTTPGSYSFTIQAIDASGAGGVGNYNIVVGAAGTIAVGPETLPDGLQLRPYPTQNITASGGTGPYSYAVTTGLLPAGLTLAPDGTLSGSPSIAGTFNFTVTATDSGGITGARAYTINVAAAPTISFFPTSLPGGLQNKPYWQNPTASGGTPGYTYSITSGTLPAGLALDPATGVVSGTPTGSGTSSFTITATDANGYTGSQPYTLEVTAAPTITISPTTLPNALQDKAYSQNVTASGGTPGYTYAVTAGTLPAGLALDTATGVVSGTPTDSGPASFTITATDANGYTGSQAYTLEVTAAPTITISPATLPNALQDKAYSQNATASGGTPGYTYAVTAGTLPAGLALDTATGVVSGTPTGSGPASFTITATDANGYTGSQAYTLEVTAAPTITISPTTLPNALQDKPYAQTVTASGGTAGYTYVVTAGTLPAGLTLNPSTGAITGTPTGSGTSNFTITATDANGYTGAQAYSLAVTAAPTIAIGPASLPGGLQDKVYSTQTLVASGGASPYTYAVTTGSLPTGLTLNPATGAISGTPTGSGTSNFTVTATDANGYTATRDYSIVVTAAPTIAIGPETLPAGVQGTVYSQSLTASGGTAGYMYTITAGSLPPGMTMSRDGVLAGTPTTPGTYTFTVTVTDANGYTSSREYTFAVNAPLAATPSDPVPTIDSSAALEPFQPVAPAGGVGPYTYEISPTLPAGLAFDPATGVISGTPTQSKPMTTYKVTITDSRSQKASQDFQMAVILYTVDLTPTNANLGRAGLPVDVQFNGTGGVGPYTIALAAGTLPPGLTLASDGRLTGRATQSGTFVVQMRVTDANGITALRQVTMVVEEARPDPTRDQGVVALQEGQADSLRRFASAQTRNTARRLEALRNCSASRNDLTLAAGEQGSVSANQLATQARAANCEQTRATWIGGTITYTEANPGGPSDLVTDGVTVGLDMRVSANVTVGAGLGYSRESSKELAGGAELSGDGYNVLAYASWEAMPRFFVEGIAGYGKASYDNERWVELEEVYASATRDTSHWFMSLGVAGVLEFGRTTLQPYLRADHQSADLDGYTEQSTGTLALQYDAASTDTTRVTGGFRANWELPVSFGIIEPMLRLEYRGEDRSGLDQGMRYADGLDGVDYRLTTSSETESAGIAGAGVGLRFTRGLSAEFEYQTSFGASLQEQSLGAHLSWSF